MEASLNLNLNSFQSHEKCPSQLLLSVRSLVEKYGQKVLADKLLESLTELVKKSTDDDLRRDVQSTFLNHKALSEMLGAEYQLTDVTHSEKCSLGHISNSPTFQSAPLPLSLLMSQLNEGIFTLSRRELIRFARVCLFAASFNGQRQQIGRNRTGQSDLLYCGRSLGRLFIEVQDKAYRASQNMDYFLAPHYVMDLLRDKSFITIRIGTQAYK